MRKYPVFKGLQKPLSFKGLKGKFIAWGVISLVSSLLLGGLVSALINIYLGGVVCVVAVVGFLAYTLFRQKQGLHSKPRDSGVFIHQNQLRIRYEKKEAL